MHLSEEQVNRLFDQRVEKAKEKYADNPRRLEMRLRSIETHRRMRLNALRKPLQKGEQV